VAKLTPASTTPSAARRAFSSRAAQAPQAIPSTLSSTVSVLPSSGGAAIVAAGRTGWWCGQPLVWYPSVGGKAGD